MSEEEEQNASEFIGTINNDEVPEPNSGNFTAEQIEEDTIGVSNNEENDNSQEGGRRRRNTRRSPSRREGGQRLDSRRRRESRRFHRLPIRCRCVAACRAWSTPA